MVKSNPKHRSDSTPADQAPDSVAELHHFDDADYDLTDFTAARETDDYDDEFDTEELIKKEDYPATDALNDSIDELGDDISDSHSDKNSRRSDARKKLTAAERSKSAKIFRVLSFIFSGLLIASSIALLIMVAIFNVLPTMYFILLLVILTLIAGGFSFLMLRPRTKPAIKIPLYLLSAVFTTIYTLGLVYLAQTFNFFDHLKTGEYITEKYYVLVEQDSPYKDIKDLDEKSIGTYNENLDIYQQALEKLKSATSAELKDIDSVAALPEQLSDHSVEGIFLSSVHKDFIAEENEKFDQSTRVIYTVEIQVPVDQEAVHPDIDVTSEPFTIFISGSDAYGNISDRSRSDVNMLATVNPKTHEVLLVSIPRDYYVQLHGTNGPKDKLTHAGIYGVKMSMQTVADLLDVPIDYYVKVNFSTLLNLVDTIGGIDVYSDQQFVPWTNRALTIPKGNVHMDGAMALAFARERKSYATGDRHRVQNQQDVLTAILKKVTSSTVILTKYSEILNDLSDCLETNIGKDEISSLIKLQLASMPNWQVASYSLNGSDSRNITYSMGQQSLYVMEPDKSTVEAARKYIDGIIEGKTIESLGIPKS